MCEFENNQNATETPKSICNVNDQGVKTDCNVRKFCSGNTSLRPGSSSDLDPDALRKLVKCSLHKST